MGTRQEEGNHPASVRIKAVKQGMALSNQTHSFQRKDKTPWTPMYYKPYQRDSPKGAATFWNSPNPSQFQGTPSALSRKCCLRGDRAADPYSAIPHNHRNSTHVRLCHQASSQNPFSPAGDTIRWQEHLIDTGSARALQPLQFAQLKQYAWTLITMHTKQPHGFTREIAEYAARAVRELTPRELGGSSRHCGQCHGKV